MQATDPITAAKRQVATWRAEADAATGSAADSLRYLADALEGRIGGVESGRRFVERSEDGRRRVVALDEAGRRRVVHEG